MSTIPIANFPMETFNHLGNPRQIILMGKAIPLEPNLLNKVILQLAQEVEKTRQVVQELQKEAAANQEKMKELVNTVLGSNRDLQSKLETALKEKLKGEIPDELLNSAKFNQRLRDVVASVLKESNYEILREAKL